MDPLLHDIRKGWKVTLGIMAAANVIAIFALKRDVPSRLFQLSEVAFGVADIWMAFELQWPRKLTLWGITIIVPTAVVMWIVESLSFSPGGWLGVTWAVIFFIAWFSRIRDLTNPIHRRALGGDDRPKKRRRRSWKTWLELRPSWGLR